MKRRILMLAAIVAVAVMGGLATADKAEAWQASVAVSASCENGVNVVHASITSSTDAGAFIIAVSPTSFPSGAGTGTVTVMVGWEESEETQTSSHEVALSVCTQPTPPPPPVVVTPPPPVVEQPCVPPAEGQGGKDGQPGNDSCAPNPPPPPPAAPPLVQEVVSPPAAPTPIPTVIRAETAPKPVAQPQAREKPRAVPKAAPKEKPAQPRRLAPPASRKQAKSATARQCPQGMRWSKGYGCTRLASGSG